MNQREQLRKLGVQPVKGQHFLESDATVEALVEAGEVDGQDVLEIGPGTGIITEKLVERASSLTVVENDTTLARHIESEFPDIEVLNKDFLELEDLEYDRCVSNLPFQISSEALRKLGDAQIQSSLIVQKQVAEKAIADPGESAYNEFSIAVQYYFVPVKLRDISRSSFHPKPEVEASILKLYPNKERHGVKDEEAFFELAKALFTHQRKKVRNAFVDARHMLGFEKDEAKEIRDDLPHSEKRVTELEVREIAEISESLRAKT
ncbi:16S rRNA (adenine(1518)-N(6)/adenine(1519)-N(6))-dimethyltransferase RsmA [Candidatus Nanohalococcus occultus]|uniref:16S rRNA A1518 and A1519 N6-dimethyltransferase RsmA/KsgA/DIM1 n=1 Tax=Candidatus Nanohalococcus occultus TaxID=2978047 RepID=A0ABY8CIC0_9ARCH|nr:16S rRNA A1518 and A1519 N6-dimethyltransferase RsmA/KsgA/DIM1 [Candidatus Nanohaloarchaeota archaeon SVXNc]